MIKAYTTKQVDFIIKNREKGLTWKEVEEAYNNKFEDHKTWNSLRKIFIRSQIEEEIGHEEADIQLLRQNRSTRVTNFRLRKEANQALDALNVRDDILAEIHKMFSQWEFQKVPAIKPAPKAKGKDCVLELLISDTHFGAKTKDYNFDVARRRMQEIRNVFFYEIEQTQLRYNIDKLVIALLGDIIASYEFHGLASAVAAEAVTPIQIVQAIDILFWELIHPVALLGHKIEIPAVCGNHDRVSKDKHMNEPGNESVSYIIYKTLETLTKAHGITNVTFDIPSKSYTIGDVFGHKVLYEHGDRGLALNRSSSEVKINSRQSQIKEIISFFRFGHFHEYAQYGRGRSIANASLVGADGYSDNAGFATEAGQTISCYVKTDDRATPFYWSYLVSVEDIK